MNFLDKIIIVAEDEAFIRMLAVEMLTDAGFQVIEAAHAEDVLTALSARPERVGVLFTDIQMPGQMNGLALAHHVRLQWPWIGVLVTSGTLTPAAADLPSASHFLAKPYKADHMVAHIRELAAA